MLFRTLDPALARRDARAKCLAAEPLAIHGKLAALHARAAPDAGVARTANRSKLPGAFLSRKIWQKISLIDHKPRAKRAKLPE